MKYFKHRGVEGLVYARVTTDDNEESGGYKTGEVKQLAPVAKIGKTVEASSNTEYYDNTPMFVTDAEGPDNFEIDATAFDLETEAELTGKTYDPDTGALIDGVREERYFALGYKTKGSDGGYRLVWRNKVKFSPLDKEHNTEDAGTGTTGSTLKWTGIHTTHVFGHGSKDAAGNWVKGTAKGVVVDTRDGLADTTDFFSKVQTPDTLKKKVGS